MALSSPDFKLRTRCVLRISKRVPPRRSIQFASFPHNRLLRISIVKYTTLNFFFFQNRNCSLSTLTFRPLAGFLLNKQLLPCMHLLPTHGMMPIITRRFLHIAHQRQRMLALVASLASRLFEHLSSVFSVGEEDALFFSCSSSFETTAGLRQDTPVFFAPSAEVGL